MRRLLLLLVLLTACVPGKRASEVFAENERLEHIRSETALLRPLYQRPGAPEPGDWPYSHEESGQTLEQYLDAEPRLPDGTRKIIYVQPLGELSAEERALVAKTAEFLGIAYALEVRTRPRFALARVPRDAQRRGTGGDQQLLTSYVLNQLLTPDLPADATAMIALTASDLWPGAGWNFVFGQASLKDRVGVWSLARLRDSAAATPLDFRVALRRMLKIAVHETGHMFSIKHCTSYRCVMAGNNGLAELDRTPLQFCPDDLAKLLWATGDDARARLTRMQAFFAREGLEDEADFSTRAIRALPQSE